MGDEVELIHLNLLSPIGREAARTFGVYIVPATLLFDGKAEVIVRKIGMPNTDRLTNALAHHKTHSPSS